MDSAAYPQPCVVPEPTCAEDTNKDGTLRRLLASLQPGSEGIVLSFGRSELVPVLAERLPPEYEIAVYDPDDGEATAPSGTPDALPALPARVRMMSGLDFGMFCDWRTRIANGQMLVVHHNPTVNRYPDKFKAFLARLDEERRLVNSNTMTAVGMGRHFVGAYIDNMPEILERPGIEALREAFAGVPAWIVGPGPSLPSAVDALRRSRGILTIAVDAALPYLREQRIVPDIVVGIDPLRENINFYGMGEEMQYWRATALVSLAQYTPEVHRTYAGPRFNAHCPGSIIFLWLAQYFCDRSVINSFGGSVSHVAFALAEIMGCSAIGLVGQDLCWRDHYYAPGVQAALTGPDSPAHDTTHALRRTNAHGDEVWMTGVLETFLVQWTNRLRRPAPVVCQCSEGGMEIPGAHYMTPLEFRAAHEPGDPIDFKTGLWAIHETARAAMPPFNRRAMFEDVRQVTRVLHGRQQLTRKILRLIREARTRARAHEREHIIQRLDAATRRMPHPVLSLVAYYHYGLELFLSRHSVQQMGACDDPERSLDEQLSRGHTYYTETNMALMGLLPLLDALRERLARGLSAK